MAKLKEEALSYEAKLTKNIADLNEVSVDIELEDDEFEMEDEKGETKVVKQKIIVVNGDKYRVPKSVLKQLKDQLEDNPDLKKFKVKKSGQGLNTDYTVIPLIKI